MSSTKEKLPVVMIVDDVAINIQVVGNILRNSLECEFTFATSGQKALELIATNTPDLILLDIMMPEMDGFEVCRQLKQQQKNKNISIIFLTARTETDDIIRGLELGAVDYVPKPFNSAELTARVKTQLKIKKQQEVIQAQNAEQRELLHVLCHDLGNPFSSLISAIELIKDFDKFEEFKPHLLSIANQGLDTIGLIRKMRKLEDMRQSLTLEAVPLHILLNESFMMLRQKFEQKNITLVNHVNQEIRVVVEITSFINSVLNNIFTNAIKFSHSGGQIDVNAEVDDDNMVLVTVTDHGIGMSPRILEDLFNIEKSCSRPGTAGEPGTGFGMPLVQKFIEAYGGHIEIRSKENRDGQAGGTTVCLSLKGS